MKVLTAGEMRACDEATFRELGVSSEAVMESAGRAVAEYAVRAFDLSKGVVVVAGGGKNGGDGYVIARALANLGIRATVFALKEISDLPTDARSHAESWVKSGGALHSLSEEFLNAAACEETMRSSSLLVDAIYGTGFRDDLKDLPLKIVTLMNAVQSGDGVPILAVDIPSGVHSDTGTVGGPAVRATATVALQFLKPGHVLFPGAEYSGDLVVADIGVWTGNASLNAVRRELMTPEASAEILRRSLPAGKEDHKGNRGHVLVIGGSTGHYGAPLLSGRSALRTGSGLVTLALPKPIADHLTPHLNELMALAVGRDEESIDIEPLARFFTERLKGGKSAVVLGPGLGQSKRAEQTIEQALRLAKESGVPIVVDADGLNVLAKRRDLRRFLSPSSVLTPHPGEMARLVGLSTQEIQRHRLKMAATLAQELSSVLVLKGARTIIAGPGGEVSINPAASPSLGTAGSGDVLAGVIASLLGQSFPALDAARLGVFLHGAAADLVSESEKEHRPASGTLGPIPIVASDLIERLPQTICRLYGVRRSRSEFIRPAFPSL